MICRTLDDVTAAAHRDALGDPPLTQAQADLLAALRATSQARPAAAA